MQRGDRFHLEIAFHHETMRRPVANAIPLSISTLRTTSGGL
jgi:hypothetical protein